MRNETEIRERIEKRRLDLLKLGYSDGVERYCEDLMWVLDEEGG